MNTEESKQIMARNIKRYMDKKGVTNQQLCDALGFKYTTFMDWIKGVTYPRIGKVEAMANYFGILKSDLIEEKTQEHREMQKKNDALSDIIIEMRTDDEFMSIVEAIYKMDKEKRSSLLAFLK
jgi:transcriptional regulator with XRE-family HTH domain